jgi:UDP-N-acetylglucosamine 2-epimerase (non-hydrolysing)
LAVLRLLSVVGARPNFMKIAPLAAELRNLPNLQHILVHSGQHYDQQLSQNFFDDLDLPRPDVNLEVGSGSQAIQTAEIMKRLEPVLLDYKPHMVIVVGDVNSTLAAALTAVKLGIAVAHIEAGLRSFDMTMPEEINRKLTDAISSSLFVTEQSGVDNLRREGVPPERIFFVGNVMIDCLERHRALAAKSPILDRFGLRSGSRCLPYAVLTLHRPSNVDAPETLQGILRAVGMLAESFPVFFPLHPRTRKNIEDFGLQNFLSDAQTASKCGIVPLNPLGYLDFLALNEHASLVLTDSGGVQEETTAIGVPCLTLRENTERPATVEMGSNQVVGVNSDRILAAARSVIAKPRQNYRCPPLWDGKAASRIIPILHEGLEKIAREKGEV